MADALTWLAILAALTVLMSLALIVAAVVEGAKYDDEGDRP